ncbi:methionyl-tRNA formyltransferase [Streptococcus pyogenes]
MIKLLFMGTPQFSATVLKGLLDNPAYEILGVVTQPDRAVGRKKDIKVTPVKQLALEHGISIYQPEKLSGSQELIEIMELGADGIITAAFGQFLPTILLDSVSFAINVHASLLPKYRGGAPIHYAIMNGDKEAGVTIMEMIKEMDAGDMVAKASTPILETDNVGTLFEKLAIIGRDLLLDSLPAYLSGELKPIPQDHSQATFSPNISPEQEKLDWTMSDQEVFNRMNPWPVAHTFLEGQRLKIYEAQLAEGEGLPGQVIVKTKKSLVIAAGQGALSLLVVQPAGKPKMAIADFLNGLGRKLEVGDFIGR